MDQSTADSITIINKQLADKEERIQEIFASQVRLIERVEKLEAKVFALLDEHHSKITGLISWTDQAPRAQS